MKKFLLTLAACGLTTGIALAQTPAPNPTANPDDPAMQPTSTTATQAEIERTGKVVSVTPTSVIVETVAGERLTLATDTKTNRAAGLAVGDAVVVRYHDMSGTLHAASITRSPAPPAVGTPTAATTPPTYPQPAPPAASATATETDDSLRSEVATDRSLPDTASPLPLVALSGSLALVAGLAARLRRRRQV
jgi:hypothetical protein